MDQTELLATRAVLFGSVFVIVQHLTRTADRELADLGLTTRQWLLLAVLLTSLVGRVSRRLDLRDENSVLLLLGLLVLMLTTAHMLGL